MFEKLCKLIAEQFGVEPDTVTKDTAFVDDLGADSVDLMDLSMALEEGGLSGIVETEFGYHIILRLPIPEETLAEHRNGFRASSLQAQAEQWQQEAQVVRADALDRLDAADFYARMNAYQTALAERDASRETPAEPIPESPGDL